MKYPLHIERRYRRFLEKHAADLRKRVNFRAVQHLRTDDALSGILAEIQANPVLTLAAIAVLSGLGWLVWRWVRRKLDDDDVPRTGLNPKAFVDVWVRQNVALIRTMDARYLDDVAKVLRDGFNKGRMTDQIANELRARFNVNLSRAQLIARDQIGKLQGKVLQEEQTAAGVTHYVWTSQHDDRVRPRHRQLDGQIFAWDAPPPDGHPGQPIQCRCYAVAHYG